MRGHIRKRGSTYSVVIELGRDPETGKRKQKWVSGFKKIKEAEKAMAELISQINNGEYIENPNQTLSDYLKIWISNHKTKVSEKTYLNYSKYIKNHIDPSLGRYKIEDIKPSHIQQLYTKLLEEKKLSANTIKYIHAILHGAFDKAVAWQMINKNPTDVVDKPKAPKKDMNVLDEHQIKKVLDSLERSPYYLPIYLAITTGMRKGEICGLKWGDIDLKKGILFIQRTRQRVNGSTQELPTKNLTSNRSVALSTETIKVLKKQRAWIAQNRLLVGDYYTDSDYVCVVQDGTPIHPEYLSQVFSKTTKKLECQVRFHDLRHTHATLLLKQGIHPKVVSERLGHSNITITLEVYSHVLPQMQKEAAEKIDEIFLIK